MMNDKQLLLHAMESADELATRLDGIIKTLMGEDAAWNQNPCTTRPPAELLNQFPLEQQPILMELWLAREEAASLGAYIDDHADLSEVEADAE